MLAISKFHWFPGLKSYNLLSKEKTAPLGKAVSKTIFLAFYLILSLYPLPCVRIKFMTFFNKLPPSFDHMISIARLFWAVWIGIGVFIEFWNYALNGKNYPFHRGCGCCVVAPRQTPCSTFGIMLDAEHIISKLHAKIKENKNSSTQKKKALASNTRAFSKIYASTGTYQGKFSLPQLQP